MAFNRRTFLSRMGIASAGVATLAACNDSGSSRQVAPALTEPEPLSYQAEGALQVDSDTQSLRFTVERSDFPGEPVPGAVFECRLHAVLADAMFWVLDGTDRGTLVQWLREPDGQAEAQWVGQWHSATGYVLTLEESRFTLSWVGEVFEAGGFAGLDALARNPFKQGVAAGDPGANSLILWTRRTGDSAHPLRWEISSSPLFESLAACGEVLPLAHQDNVVKVVATGLAPAQTWYYRFLDNGMSSLVGRARTLPAADADIDALKLAVVSCSSYPHGYFVGYRNIARRDDLDYVVHLGDYIYEYTEDEYGNADVVAQGRTYAASNQKEILNLQDYRERYQRYREDVDLQLLHSRYAFITTWDDHETTDNSYDPDGAGSEGGAVNHTDSSEGLWESRKALAVQAYNEWMPIADIADPGDPQIHRSFVFGRLMELMMLDTRIGGRHHHPDIASDDFNDPHRRLISPLQEAWLLERLGKAQGKRTWKLLGQQVMMAPFQGPPILGGTPSSPPTGPVSPEWLNVLNTDGWDGYAANRQVIWDYLAANRVDNVVVLTGDIHTSWAMELQQPVLLNASVLNANPGIEPLVQLQGPKYGVEFVTPSITSPGLEAYIPSSQAVTAAEETLKLYNPHIKYSNLSQRGYMILDITPAQCTASWFHLSDVTDWVNSGERLAAQYRTAAGSAELEALA